MTIDRDSGVVLLQCDADGCQSKLNITGKDSASLKATLDYWEWLHLPDGKDYCHCHHRAEFSPTVDSLKRILKDNGPLAQAIKSDPEIQSLMAPKRIRVIWCSDAQNTLRQLRNELSSVVGVIIGFEDFNEAEEFGKKISSILKAL